jgi:hypothetical protein
MKIDTKRKMFFELSRYNGEFTIKKPESKLPGF